MNITSYSDKSFVVRGDTKPHLEQLKSFGGKWNALLQGGAGWIFSNKKLKEVEGFIQTTELLINSDVNPSFPLQLTVDEKVQRDQSPYRHDFVDLELYFKKIDLSKTDCVVSKEAVVSLLEFLQAIKQDGLMDD